MVYGHALFPHRLRLNPRPNIFPTSVKNYTHDYLKKALFRVNIHCGFFSARSRLQWKPRWIGHKLLQRCGADDYKTRPYRQIAVQGYGNAVSAFFPKIQHLYFSSQSKTVTRSHRTTHICLCLCKIQIRIEFCNFFLRGFFCKPKSCRAVKIRKAQTINAD